MKTLGLIGGTTYLSTIDYYRFINEGVHTRLGGDQYASCILHSFNFAEMVEFNKRRDWDGLLEVVAAAAENLKKSGAQGLVLCANTLHVIAERLEQRVGLPLISIVDAT